MRRRNMMINQHILGIRSVVNRGSNFHWGWILNLDRMMETAGLSLIGVGWPSIGQERNGFKSWKHRYYGLDERRGVDGTWVSAVFSTISWRFPIHLSYRLFVPMILPLGSHVGLQCSETQVSNRKTASPLLSAFRQNLSRHWWQVTLNVVAPPHPTPPHFQRSNLQRKGLALCKLTWTGKKKKDVRSVFPRQHEHPQKRL